MPEDGHDRSQDLILLERAIYIGKRVATGDEGVAAFGDEPVGYKAMVAITQHNLAGPEFHYLAPAHCEDVAGPYGGEHAGSGDLEAHFSKSANDLCNQVAFCRVLKVVRQLLRDAVQYQGAACEACTAQPPVPPEVAQFWLPRLE